MGHLRGLGSGTSGSCSPVVIISGPPGVGKTTVAANLAERFDRAVHLEADAFFGFIRAGYAEPWKPESHAQNEVVMSIVAQVAVGYAAGGYLTIVDGIVIPGWFLEPLCDAIRDAGHPVAYAVLRAPLSVCVERAANREDRPFLDGVVIERLWRSFAELGELEPNAVDVEEESPGEIADVLAARAADGSLAI
jgi:tRNA uridine 5-carbamoylmethylation protein Kti12